MSPVAENARPVTSSANGGGFERPIRRHHAASSLESPQKAWQDFSPGDSGPNSAQSPKTFDNMAFMRSENAREHTRNFSITSPTPERIPSDENATTQKVPPLKAGKGRMHLLNPMNLLQRRRASGNQAKPEDGLLSTSSLTVPAIPDDYDPRIRGKIVHDFSAPRSRRIQSFQDSPKLDGSPNVDQRSSPQFGRRASDLPGLGDTLAERNINATKHAPMFREHFEEDTQTLQPGNKEYLHRFAHSTQLNGDQSSAEMPEFAKKLPTVIPENEALRTRPAASPPLSTSASAKVPPQVPASIPASRDGKVVIPPIPPPVKPPPAPPVNETSLRRAIGRQGQLRQMKSTSSRNSRFSFQMQGVDSAAQEKLLEDKHRQQQALKKLNGEPELDEEDEFADFDMDDDDGLEERIPGINADPEDDDDPELEEEIPGVNVDSDSAVALDDGDGPHEEELAHTHLSTIAHDFHFTPASISTNCSTTNGTSEATPRDESGRVIGVAGTTDSPYLSQAANKAKEDARDEHLSAALNGLGITAPAHSQTKDPRSSIDLAQPGYHGGASFDDDIYFDDGEFDEFGEGLADDGFDEAMFDDESKQIRDIPADNAKKFEAAQKLSRGEPETGKSAKSFAAAGLVADHLHPVVEVEAPMSPTSDMPSSEWPSSPPFQPDSLPEQNGGLTEGNLAAYHDALAMAAVDAAATGRFTRQSSKSQYSEDQYSSSQLPESHPGLVSDDSRPDLHLSGFEDDGPFPFDDGLDDDPMIAAANAEALENDDEGFYGQEFGFYARAHGKDVAEQVNGGFFGPRGTEGVKRSHSGKAHFQEPSLTPITERSEWSTRNSVASLHIPNLPLSAQSIPSPGIAQLIDFEYGSFDEEDMSLSALAKLRRAAWGGSSTSVNSLGAGSHTSSSPLTNVGAKDFAQAALHSSNGHRMTSSITSLTESAGIPESEEEDDDYERDVPTAMQNTPRKTSAEPATASTIQSPQLLPGISPTSSFPEKTRGGHSRNSSGAESISYVKDPEGSGRWVLERRRTGDDGVPEVVGREYVGGMRI